MQNYIGKNKLYVHISFFILRKTNSKPRKSNKALFIQNATANAAWDAAWVYTERGFGLYRTRPRTRFGL